MTDEATIAADVYQVHADTVREAADKFNRAIAAAEKIGLRVELLVKEREIIGYYDRSTISYAPSAVVNISRPL